jgi:hypothetical protein
VSKEDIHGNDADTWYKFANVLTWAVRTPGTSLLIFSLVPCGHPNTGLVIVLLVPCIHQYEFVNSLTSAMHTPV